ncbi:MAG: heme ABC transporter permease CcmB [Desulfovibrionaceae bacterium CG1_02_65_16]|nr:MAG: heme ABC transporter permease CcmB [Desulfovibrionaceae bacterium CG1_02_65_16]
MLRRAGFIAAKDLRLSAGGGQGLVQAVLLGLLLIFLFSLSRSTTELVSPQAAAAIFWLASAFGLVLVFNDLFSIEEAQGCRMGLLSSPVPEHAVWLGKGLAGFALLIVSQAVFLPASAVFLGQDIKGDWGTLLLTLAGVDWGLAALGALLGALSQGQGARESLFSVILFPLLLPVLLGGIRIFAGCFSGEPAMDQQLWSGVIVAFDAVFTAAGAFLFPFLYTGEE